MKRDVITFATAAYISSAKKLEQSIIGKPVTIYTEKDLDQKYWDLFSEHHTYNRGYGFWSWKAWIIRNHLNTMDEGDEVLYLDAGIEAIRDLEPLFQLLNSQDVVGFKLTHPERHYTKPYLLEKFDKYDIDFDSRQIMGGVVCFRKSKFTMNFIDEWIAMLSDIKNVNDNAYGYKYSKKFQYHRHDQSIFSLIYKKNHLEGFADPSQYGNVQEQQVSGYGTLLNIHRRHKFSIRIKWQKTIYPRLKRILRLLNGAISNFFN